MTTEDFWTFNDTTTTATTDDTITINGNYTLTASPYITTGTYTFTPNDPPKTIEQILKDIKELEQEKIRHKLEDLHILMENGDWFYSTYVFVTEHELQLLKKYSTQIVEVSSLYAFNSMLSCIENKSAILKLASSGEEYDNLDDLRKDHLVLKLAGV